MIKYFLLGSTINNVSIHYNFKQWWTVMNILMLYLIWSFRSWMNILYKRIIPINWLDWCQMMLFVIILYIQIITIWIIMHDMKITYTYFKCFRVVKSSNFYIWERFIQSSLFEWSEAPWWSMIRCISPFAKVKFGQDTTLAWYSRINLVIGQHHCVYLNVINAITVITQNSGQLHLSDFS